jgi:hypothetical protein
MLEGGQQSDLIGTQLCALRKRAAYITIANNNGKGHSIHVFFVFSKTHVVYVYAVVTTSKKSSHQQQGEDCSAPPHIQTQRNAHTHIHASISFFCVPSKANFACVSGHVAGWEDVHVCFFMQQLPRSFFVGV